MNEECKLCGGSGVVYIPITVAGCCGNAMPNGECCGNAIPVQDFEIDQCSCGIKSVSVQRQDHKTD